MNNTILAIKTARNSIIINVLLSAFKLFAGVFAHSAAMVADAIHSITDSISTVVVIIGIRLAGKEDDADHPYGHERFECVATLILILMIAVVGIGIGWSGIQTILARDYEHLSIPGLLALIAAVASIVVKEGLYWYVRAVAKKIDSSSLMVDAVHSRIDGLSSIGSFIGIFVARLGFPIFDPIAAIVICLFIFKTVISETISTLGKMTDSSCDDTTINKMRELIMSQEHVQKIDTLKTRRFANKIYVDIEICVDKELSLVEAHDISDKVHEEIEKHFTKVKHCMVHVSPI